MKIKLIFLFLLSFIANSLFAQTQDNPFYSYGKIYVVVTVISIIFTGIIIYLIQIDRRLRKTEKELKDKN
jgi:CcmD family protein